jgi:hypothetical protein
LPERFVSPAEPSAGGQAPGSAGVAGIANATAASAVLTVHETIDFVKIRANRLGRDCRFEVAIAGSTAAKFLLMSY